MSPNGNDPDATSIQTELLASCDAVPMGRRTYEGFASVWPTRSGDDYSDRINSMRKYVASSTLRDPKWKNTVVINRDDLIGETKQLKPGKDTVQYGIGDVSYEMMKHDSDRRIPCLDSPNLPGQGRP